MNEKDVIYNQAVKIETMIERISELDNAVKECLSQMTQVGGPLNENALGFSREQLVFIFKLHRILSYVVSYKEG